MAGYTGAVEQNGFEAALTGVEALLATGRYPEAEAACRALALREPEAPAPARLLGHMLLQRGAWAEAVPWLQRAHGQDPGEAQGAFELSWCLLKLERPAEAAAVLGVLEATPAVRHVLGRAQLALGQGAAARDSLLGCGLPAADLELGWAHWVLGEGRAARAAWERWMRAGAADWGTKDALATFLFLLGGGMRPGGRPERPAEPVRHLTEWLRWLIRHGRLADVDTALLRGPRLEEAFWGPLRAGWRHALREEGEADRADRLGP